MYDTLYDFFEDNLGEGSGDIATQVLTIVLIVLVTWLARRLISLLTPWILNTFVKRTKTEFDNRLLEVATPPLRFLVTLLGGWLVLIALELPVQIDNFIDRLMASLIAVAIFWGAYRLVDLIVEVFWRLGRTAADDDSLVRTLFEERLAQITRQVLKAIIVVFAISVVMEEWGYDVDGLVAGLGLGGLAVALAAQDALANLFGYFVILADAPYVHDEYIIVNGETSGIVEEIGFRSTRIRALDQSLIFVPNKTIMNANITNWSRLAKRRLNMTLGIEYSSSPDQVLSVVQAIREMLHDHHLVQTDSVIVQFVEFNESSLDIMIICFMTTTGWGDFQAAKQDINLRIMTILEQHGVDVAFPTRTLFLERAADPELVHAPMPEPKPEPTISTAIDSPVPDDAEN
ncbi:MAG: mechanosensitive ion channel family protein [Chloroflexi bacterium]|nr:mechanosensitive ion channel family protein [Chloroflexota bacterium]